MATFPYIRPIGDLPSQLEAAIENARASRDRVAPEFVRELEPQVSTVSHELKAVAAAVEKHKVSVKSQRINGDVTILSLFPLYPSPIPVSSADCS